MGVKILLPTAGIVGTLASVVGVSTSNQRSKRAANDQASHNWKIEVDEISAELICEEQQVRGEARYTRGLEPAVLKWSMKLSEGKKNNCWKKTRSKITGVSH